MMILRVSGILEWKKSTRARVSETRVSKNVALCAAYHCRILDPLLSSSPLAYTFKLEK